ncbi:MAG: hypothetical protein HYX64_08105 [Gammaproteobacteria bacterium]|nr:hypothetical protein [Gammaproteobacteria bacterium]
MKLKIGAFLLAPALAFAQGYLENPQPYATESGIGVVSGWHCTATDITVTIDGTSLGKSGSGTYRGDTAGVCGHTATGFSLLYNYNRLAPGPHTIRVYADGVLLEERPFNSVKSGGADFLTGVTKSVDVPDFPSAGSTARLTWSQAKQSFVVTHLSLPGTGTGQISDLYGLMTLNYAFDIAPTLIFTDSVQFSSADLDSNQIVVDFVIGDSTRFIACRVLNVDGYEFVCVASPVGPLVGDVDEFALNVSDAGFISGIYEYCLAGTSGSDCSRDLIAAPDGTVTGFVNRAAVGVEVAPIPSSDAVASSASKESLKLEASQTVMPQPELTPEEAARAAAIADALEKLIQ